MSNYKKQIDQLYSQIKDHELKIVETRARESDDMDRVEFLLAKERERGKEMDKKIV